MKAAFKNSFVALESYFKMTAFLPIFMYLTYCGSGGIVDNGVKPEPKEVENDASAESSIMKDSSARLILSGRYSVELPGEFSATDHGLKDSVSDRFVSGDLFVEIKPIARPCKPEVDRVNPYGMGINECAEGVIHFRTSALSVMELHHNVSHESAFIISDSIKPVD